MLVSDDYCFGHGLQLWGGNIIFAHLGSFLKTGIGLWPIKLRAYPNNRVVMRPSEKFEAKAAGAKLPQA